MEQSGYVEYNPITTTKLNIKKIDGERVFGDTTDIYNREKKLQEKYFNPN